MAHYQEAQGVFEDMYAFLTKEYSNRDSFLGPYEKLLAEQPNLTIDDNAAPARAIGTVAGFVIHPDYPEPNETGSRDGREAHRDHIHVNLGHNGPNKSTGLYRGNDNHSEAYER